MKKPFRVFLVDDHELIRRGLRDCIEAEEDLIVVGEAATAGEALARIPVRKPDICVLDVRLPDGSGIEVCREIRSHHPEIEFLMLTTFTDDEALFDAIMAGAIGYVLKETRADHLVESLRSVARGQSLLDPAMTDRVLARLRQPGQGNDPLDGLTGQERRILALIGEGLTNREIAKRTYLAEKTVKNYVSNLLRKLGMQHRVQAALYASHEGVRPLGD